MSDSVNQGLLEQRVAQLEAIVSSISGTTDNNRAGGKPPKPTNLSVVTQPGIIAFEWDPSTASDLLYYRIQISESEGMTNAFETTTVDPRYTYYQGVPGITYFARVAAVNRSGRASDYTTPLSSAVGLVEAELLDTSANIQMFRFVKTSGFTSLSVTGATKTLNETYGPLEVTCDSDDSIVDLRVSLIGLLDVSFSAPANPCFFTLDLFRRTSGGTDSTVWSIVRDISYTRGGAGAPTEPEYIAFPAFTEVPGAGSWEYRFKVTVTIDGSNDIIFQGTDLRMLALVFN